MSEAAHTFGWAALGGVIGYCIIWGITRLFRKEKEVKAWAPEPNNAYRWYLGCQAHCDALGRELKDCHKRIHNQRLELHHMNELLVEARAQIKSTSNPDIVHPENS